MFTIKSCFTVTEPPVCDLTGLVGLLPDVKRCVEILWCTHTHAHTCTHKERERGLLVSTALISVDFSCLRILTKGLFKRDPARVVIF